MKIIKNIFLSVLIVSLASLHAQDSSIASVISNYEATLTQQPSNDKLHAQFGEYLANLDLREQDEKALYHLTQAAKLDPHNVQYLFKLGAFACRIGHIRKSLDTYRSILDINPTIISVLYNAGFTFKTAGYNDIAIKIYKKILSLNPNYTPAHLGLAFAYLSKGAYADGWREHIWNLQEQGKDSPELRTFLKEGTIADKRILLVPEGGLGDTLHFVRYAQRLKSMGAHITVICQQPLIPLLSRCDYIDSLVPLRTPVSDYDAKATLMSLATFFTDEAHAMSQNIPYLSADPKLIAQWKNQFKNDHNFKIGVCWQPDVHNDVSRLPIARRGIPLSYFHRLSQTPGITLYSLQKKEGLDQLATTKNYVNIKTFDEGFDESHGNFMDTAAVMECLDLIITTDTATAHLAGALGKRTWLLLPFAIDWRWLAHRNDTPWYPTMRIFQQDRPFDWDTVMHNLHTIFFNEVFSEQKR